MHFFWNIVWQKYCLISEHLKLFSSEIAILFIEWPSWCSAEKLDRHPLEVGQIWLSEIWPSEFPVGIPLNSRKNIIVDKYLNVITCVKSLTLLKKFLIRSLCVQFVPKNVIFDQKMYFLKFEKYLGHWNCNKKISGAFC